MGRLGKRNWLTKNLIALCAVLVATTGVAVCADNESDVEVQIERVALFKNGLGYFASSATLPENATIINMGQLPVPSHGTFWVGYPEDVKVRAILTSMEETDKSLPASTIAELLQTNTGRKVTVYSGSKDMPVVKGTIVSVTPDTKSEISPGPYSMDARRLSVSSVYPAPKGSQLAIIKTNEGNVAVNVGSIVRADFEDDDILSSVSITEQQPGIRMELEKAAGGREVGVSYLSRGITWSPSYLIDLSDPTTARLSAKAVVINEVADLEGVHLDLVTGYPNIKFGDVNSPVAMSQSLESFLASLNSGGSRRDASVITNQMGLPFVRGGRGDEVMLQYSTAQTGSVSEDLFFYPVKNFSLLRGETACIPLFTAEVPYKHLYIWEIPDMLDENERYRPQRQMDEQAPAEKVWHTCRLVNNMEMPWTTAPAEFVTDGQFTGQDICYYTAPGAETTIRINQALNILAEEVELEVERQRHAATFYGSSHDLVKVKGELNLENRLGKKVTVEITKNLSGEVLTSAPPAKDVATAKGLKRMNPRHMLRWEIELEPGQEQTLSYTYNVYVRN